MATLFEAYVTNAGKYSEGQLVGETLKFPTTAQEVEALLKRIGVDGVRYQEIFITSFDGDVLGLYDHLSEYENLDELVDMISGMEVKEDDEDFMNAVDYMFAGLEKRKPDCFAVKQYKKYKLASGKTAKSILISCGARLAPFDIPQLREVMAYDELELDRIGDRKTAVFFIISDTTQTYNFLVALAFSQMFNLLCERADNVHGGRLPHHVRVLWDEAANTGQVPQLEKLVAVIRSREVSLCLLYQQLAQCKAIYDTLTVRCRSSFPLSTVVPIPAAAIKSISRKRMTTITASGTSLPGC